LTPSPSNVSLPTCCLKLDNWNVLHAINVQGVDLLHQNYDLTVWLSTWLLMGRRERDVLLCLARGRARQQDF
jgi:hypothetical protein